MLVNDLFLACNDWFDWTSVNVFDIDKCEEHTFYGDGCLPKYGSYHVKEFSVLPLVDSIYLRVER